MKKTQKVVFISEIEHLQITASLGRGERLGNLWITNDPKTALSKVSTIFPSAVGEIEMQYLWDAGAIVYGVEEVEPFPDRVASMDYLKKTFVFC